MRIHEYMVYLTISVVAFALKFPYVVTEFGPQCLEGGTMVHMLLAGRLNKTVPSNSLQKCSHLDVRQLRRSGDKYRSL